MRIFKIKVVLILLFLSSSYIKSQVPLILNGDFEASSNNNLPNGFGDFDMLLYWKDDASGSNNLSHSADWLHTSLFHFAQSQSNYVRGQITNGPFSPLQAKSGGGYAGMLHSEMIFQEISSNTNKEWLPLTSDDLRWGETYKLKLNLKLTDNYLKAINNSNLQSPYTTTGTPEWPSDAKLNVFVSSLRPDYRNTWGNCWEGTYQKDYLGFAQTVLSIPLSLDRFPSNGWHTIEAYIIPNRDNVYEWIAFEFEYYDFEFEEGCHQPYLLLDDISLEKISCDECQTCSNKDGCINLDVEIDDTGLLQLHKVTGLDNVTYAIIAIHNTLGQKIREYELTNPPSEFFIDQLFPNGQQMVAGYYDIHVIAENDCTANDYWESVQFDGRDYSNYNVNNIENDRKNICCGEDLTLSNITFIDEQSYIAGKVYIGPRVIIKEGGDITIKAEEFIKISPDFEVQEKGVFEAYIEPCNEDELEASIKRLDQFTFQNIQSFNKRHRIRNETQVNIFPNPVSTNLNIKLPQSTFDKIYIEIYSIDGQIVYQSVRGKSNILQIDVSTFSSGNFILKLKIDDTWLNSKLFIIE